MPEDTRIQQQVHMHIWMEADIIMVIVSDARGAVKVTLDLLGWQILDVKHQKNPLFATRAFREGMSN